MKSRPVQRRKFLQAAAAAAAASAASCGGKASPWRFFSVEEAATLAAVCDRIIPPDQDPGASAADVVNYIDRQLAGPLKRYRRAYREGLPALARFAALAPAEQDALLAAMEARREPFFEMVRDHAMQGFYGDPRHGGNREYASWAMLNVPSAPVRGRQLYDLSGEGMTRRTRRPTWRSNG
ncbi:MAG: gluconate 2-dehydrogenase subunit 3 family protein [Bryobacteraceae bacterium]|jgi:gluconate 2-dehydrogenase gamma chain